MAHALYQALVLPVTLLWRHGRFDHVSKIASYTYANSQGYSGVELTTRRATNLGRMHWPSPRNLEVTSGNAALLQRSMGASISGKNLCCHV